MKLFACVRRAVRLVYRASDGDGLVIREPSVEWPVGRDGLRPNHGNVHDAEQSG